LDFGQLWHPYDGNGWCLLQSRHQRSFRYGVVAVVEVVDAVDEPASWQKRFPRVPTGFAVMCSWILFRSTINPSRSRWSGPSTRLRTSHWPAAIVGPLVVV